MVIRNNSVNATNLLGHVDQGIMVVVQELLRVAGRRVRTRLVNRCGSDLPVRFSNAEFVSLGSVQDRIESQEGGAYIAFRVDPGDTPGMLVIEGPLLFRLVGLLLGEAPEIDSPIYRFRALSNVDLRIAKRIAEDALDGLVDALNGAVENEIRIEGVSSSPRWSFPLPRSTTVFEGTLDLGPPDDPFGLLSFVLPAAIARQMVPGVNTRDRVTDKLGLDEAASLPVTVTAELTSIKMQISELNDLQVGTEIVLGNVGKSHLCVGGRRLFEAEAGDQDGVRSVKVSRRIS